MSAANFSLKCCTQTSGLKKREELKGRLKAMRIRIKKKRERFLSALKQIDRNFDKEKNPADLMNRLNETIRIDDGYNDDDEDDDTLRSIEVSFVADNHCLAPIRHSIVSRTSTPIFLKSISSRSSLMNSAPPVPVPPSHHQIAKSKLKCCRRRESTGSKWSNKYACDANLCNYEYLSSSLSTASYMTSIGGSFQNCGEFKVWFV